MTADPYDVQRLDAHAAEEKPRLRSTFVWLGSRVAILAMILTLTPFNKPNAKEFLWLAEHLNFCVIMLIVAAVSAFLSYVVSFIAYAVVPSHSCLNKL